MSDEMESDLVSQELNEASGSFPGIVEIVRREVRDALAEFMSAQPNYGGVIKKLRLEPGEILCLFCPGHLRPEQHAGIQNAMTSYFPNRKVLIFDEGMDLRVLHEEHVEESDVVDG